MRIAVVGGHGQIARQLHPLLVTAGRQPVALVRNESHRAELEAAGAEVRLLDIEQEDAAAFAGRSTAARPWSSRPVAGRTATGAQADRRPRGVAEVDRGRAAGRDPAVRAGVGDRRRPPVRRTPARSGGRTSRPSATPTPRCAPPASTGRSSAPGGSPTTPTTGLVALGPDVARARCRAPTSPPSWPRCWTARQNRSAVEPRRGDLSVAEAIDRGGL